MLEITHTTNTTSSPLDSLLASRETNAGFYIENVLHVGGFPVDSMVKNPVASVGDLSSIPWSERLPGEGNGNPLQ